LNISLYHVDIKGDGRKSQHPGIPTGGQVLGVM
jgi:hypothetical protein